MAIPDGWVTYSDVVLGITVIKRWETRTVASEDGADRMLLHHVFAIQSVWNPAATTLPGFQLNGLTSVAAVKEKLLRPREQLLIVVNGDELLRLPKKKADGTPYPCDAKNGPNPISVSITEITGIKTCIVLWECEAWEAIDCPKNPLSIISHRWEAAESFHDSDQFLSTRTITGTATFRADMLRDAGKYADEFRERFFHPILPNTRRERINVRATSDNTACVYSFSDVEQPINLDRKNPWGVTKFRGKWKLGFNQSSFLSPPYRYVSFSCQVWGGRTSDRQNLVDACMHAASTFGFGTVQFGVAGAKPFAELYFKADLEVDLWDRFAQLNAGYLLDGWSGAIVDEVPGILDGIGNAIKGFAEGVGGAIFKKQIDEGLKGQDITVNDPFVIARQLIINGRFPNSISGLTSEDSTVENPRPPRGRGSQGNIIEALVTQALNAPCVTPPKPLDLPPGVGGGWGF